MGTTTLLTLHQKLSEMLGDYIQVATTTNIGAGTVIKSTHLNKYDDGNDNTFNDWYVYIMGTNNDGVERRISDYDQGTGQITVYGANLSQESAAVNIRVCRYSKTNKDLAINNAINETYPILHRKAENRELVTGNVLPPFIWATSSTLDIWDEPTGTFAKNTTGDYIWNGQSSAKITASGADDYMYLDSFEYPPILDLMGKTIDYKCWTYPEDADDDFLTIYTVKADGTAQTLNSTTSCPATKHTLLELESQSINDNIQQIQFRLRVHTDTKYGYFSTPRTICDSLHVRQHILPKDFQEGDLEEVWIQRSGDADDICDDLFPQDWDRIFGYKVEPMVLPSGTYKSLILPAYYSHNRQIKLVGTCPLETLSSDTDTISLSGEEVYLLLAYAAHLLYAMEGEPVASEDVGRVMTQSEIWRRKYYEILNHLRMATPSVTMKLNR